MGRIPTFEEYMNHVKALDSTADETYQYLNFDKMKAYQP
jgi:aconitate hydratase 2/2-methylisocitrate dehydratase